MPGRFLSVVLLGTGVCLACVSPVGSTEFLAEIQPGGELPATTLERPWEHLEETPTSPVCGPDQILYAQAKSTGIQSVSINNTTSARGTAQWFDAPEPLSVSGFDFYASSQIAPGAITVTASIYLADASMLPTGSALASVQVPVANEPTEDLAPLRHGVVFPSAVYVAAPFVLVVENHSAANLLLVCSDYQVADGGGEYLASVDLGGTWMRTDVVYIGGYPFDADWLFDPTVSFEPAAAFSATPPCLSGPATVEFSNESSAFYENRFYNRHAFFGTPELIYTWDPGDGSATSTTVDFSHAFADEGPYTVVLDAALLGWNRSCARQVQHVVGPLLGHYYPDQDGDGLGDSAASPIATCDPQGLVQNFADCDDAASSCTDDCLDIDGDSFPQCQDLCTDSDFDDYGTDMSLLVVGSSAVPVGLCTSNGVTPCSFPDAACIAEDTCEGFDDGVDSDLDGVPDGCDLCFGDDATCFVFEDGFETGGTGKWSATEPPTA